MSLLDTQISCKWVMWFLRSKHPRLQRRCHWHNRSIQSIVPATPKLPDRCWTISIHWLYGCRSTPCNAGEQPSSLCWDVHLQYYLFGWLIMTHTHKSHMMFPPLKTIVIARNIGASHFIPWKSVCKRMSSSGKVVCIRWIIAGSVQTAYAAYVYKISLLATIQPFGLKEHLQETIIGDVKSTYKNTKST